jgi:hypothetical protein
MSRWRRRRRMRSRGLARCESRQHMSYWARTRQGSAPLPMAAAARRWRPHAFDLMLIKQRSHMHHFPSSAPVHERNSSGACCAFARDAISCQNCSAGPHFSCRRKRSGVPPPPSPSTLLRHAQYPLAAAMSCQSSQWAAPTPPPSSN